MRSSTATTTGSSGTQNQSSLNATLSIQISRSSAANNNAQINNGMSNSAVLRHDVATLRRDLAQLAASLR